MEFTDCIAQAFKTAYAGIKPLVGVYVGVFLRDKSDICANAEIVRPYPGRCLSAAPPGPLLFSCAP